MGFFKKKEDKFVDWTNRSEKRERKSNHAENSKKKSFSQTSDKEGFVSFPFFNSPKLGSENIETSSENSKEQEFEDQDDKKRKLVKRLSDMTNKMEDLSNQIYHLQQRIEVLERKAGVWGGASGDISGTRGLSGDYGVF